MNRTRYFIEQCLKVNNAVSDLEQYEPELKHEAEKNAGVIFELYDYFDPQFRRSPGELDLSISVLEDANNQLSCMIKQLEGIREKIREQETITRQ